MKAIVRMGILIFAIFSLLMIGLSPSWAGINDGLVAYYPFNGNANDESGNVNNGTVYGATLTTDRFGNPNSAYSFNGENMYISVADNVKLSFDVTSPFSISLWALKTESRNMRLLGKRTGCSGDPNSVDYEIFLDTTYANGLCLYGTLWACTTGGLNDLPLDTWTFVTGTFDGSVLRLYVNGTLVASSIGTLYSQNSSPLTIGASGTCQTYDGGTFGGTLDDVRIYNRALTEAEIHELAQESAGDPKISVSPMSVNLGSLRAGSVSNPKTITIKNKGKGTLIIDSITISGPNQSEFIESDDCSIIAAKSSCPITVSMAPVSPFGKKSAIMSISSNDPKKPTINVKLSGQAPPPKITASPKTANVGSVGVGTTSAPKIVKIKNTGTSDLAVNVITIAGTDALEFSHTSDCTTLAKGSSCGVAVTFSPNSAGSKSAVLNISSNDPKHAMTSIKLVGKATGGVPGDAILTSVIVTPVNPSIAVGSSQQFTATGTYSDSTTKDITSSVTWSSSNTSVGTINNTGLATAVASGSTTVTAAYGSISGSTILAVVSNPPPAAPTGVSAVAGDGEVTVSWNTVTGATSYNLYYSTTPGVTKTNSAKITGVTTPYTIDALANGTPYYFVVTALNANGESAVSAPEGSATPTAQSITALLIGTWTLDASQTVWPGHSLVGETGTAIFRADNTFSLSFFHNGAPDGIESFTYSVAGNVMTAIIVSSDDPSDIGQIAIKIVTFVNNNNTVIFVNVPDNGERDVWNRQ